MTRRNTMKTVVIESPYRAGNGRTVEDHRSYIDHCSLDSLSRSESPYASHLMLTGALDDSDPVQRHRGIAAGYAFSTVCHAVVFYTDLGWSDGMKLALTRAKAMGLRHEIRTIDD